MPSSMTDAFHGPLSRGSAGKDVTRLQDRLNALQSSAGVAAITADGAFGRKTAERVKMFQEAQHLTADGIVGPLTAKALGFENYVSTRPPQTRVPRGGLAEAVHGAVTGATTVHTNGPPAPPSPPQPAPFRAALQALQAAIAQIRARIAAAFAAIELIAQPIISAVAGAANTAIAALGQLIYMGADMADIVLNTVRSILRQLGQGINASIRAIIQRIPFGPVVTFVSNAAQRILNAVAQVAQQLIDWAVVAITSMSIVGMVGGIIAAFMAQVEDIVM